MPREERNTVKFEDVQIIWRNFEGREGPINRKGDRNFNIIMPDKDIADQMFADGWNIKYKDPREEGDEGIITLAVAVSYKSRPPRVVMVMPNGKQVNLNEENIEILDHANIEKCDVIVNPYAWSVQGKDGVKAYLKTLIVVIAEDDLEAKWGVNRVQDVED